MICFIRCMITGFHAKGNVKVRKTKISFIKETVAGKYGWKVDLCGTGFLLYIHFRMPVPSFADPESFFGIDAQDIEQSGFLRQVLKSVEVEIIAHQVIICTQFKL